MGRGAFVITIRNPEAASVIGMDLARWGPKLYDVFGNFGSPLFYPKSPICPCFHSFFSLFLNISSVWPGAPETAIEAIASSRF